MKSNHIKVGGLGESAVDCIIKINDKIAQEILGRFGLVLSPLQFIKDYDLFLQLENELNTNQKFIWMPGGTISNTLYTMGICQKSRSTPLDIYLFGNINYHYQDFRSYIEPINSLRRVSIIPYCIPSKATYGRTLCIVSMESGKIISILVYDEPSEEFNIPDRWPYLDILIIKMKNLTGSCESYISYQRHCKYIALILGDIECLDRNAFEVATDLAQSGRLKWVFGQLNDLHRFCFLDDKGASSAFKNVEIIGTQGADPVMIWDPVNLLFKKLEVNSIKQFHGTDLGAGDAYAGAYLFNRILGKDIESAHGIAFEYAKCVMDVDSARIPPEKDLNAIFGSMIDRSSTSKVEAEFFNRCRITPGLTIISGGQTGIDQIGLQNAAKLGIASFCILPKDRRTEFTEGLFNKPDDFGGSYIHELDSSSYRYRTWACAFLADGTLIWDFHGSEGSAATQDACSYLGRPFLDVTNWNTDQIQFEVLEWVKCHNLRVINIAGNRGSLLSSKELIETNRQMFDLFKGLACNLVKPLDQSWHRDYADLISGQEVSSDSRLINLIIGVPNTTPQRTLIELFLKEAYGLNPVEQRQLIADYQDASLKIVFARARDLPCMLNDEAIDLVFCGNDLLDEAKYDYTILYNTGLFGVLLVLVGDKCVDIFVNNLKIGSQYPSLGSRLLYNVKCSTYIRPIHGTAEAWINIGLINAAVDTWRTGATVDSNGLELYRIFGKSFLVAAVNPISDELIKNKARYFVWNFISWLLGKDIKV
jgi:ATP phosphoribosyltransferase